MNIILLISIVSLFFIAAFAMWVGSIHSRYRRRVHKLRLEKIANENKLADSTAQANEAKKRIRVLKAQIESINISKELGTSQSAASVSIIDALLHTGIIDNADIKRAEEFKKKSHSDASIEEILTLLGLVTPEQMAQAKKR